MTFTFYKGKDFPPGNYQVEEDTRINHLKTVCRNDEKCAGFSTDGSLKRFIPYQLSQLVPFKSNKKSLYSTKDTGLYVKITPCTYTLILSPSIVFYNLF